MYSSTAVREDHVVDPLERVARDPRVLPNELEVVLEGAFPVEFLVLLRVLKVRDGAENIDGLGLSFICFLPSNLPCGNSAQKKRSES